MPTAAAPTVQPGSAKFTYGHLFVLIGAVLGVVAFVDVHDDEKEEAWERAGVRLMALPKLSTKDTVGVVAAVVLIAVAVVLLAFQFLIKPKAV